MFAPPVGRTTLAHEGKRAAHATRRRARARQLTIEPLEQRYLMTASSFIGPLPPGVAAPTGIPGVSPGPAAAAPISTSQPVGESAAAQSIDQFGLKLYQELQATTGGSGNMFLSPFSISTALDMAYAGARGETAAQMASALDFSGNQATVAAEFGSLLSDLNSSGQGNYTLAVADALWGQQGVNFISDFLNTMQTDFGGGLNQVDFQNQPEAVRQEINQWIASHTNDKIQDMLPPGAITSLTRLVLANAIYFQGNWARAFSGTTFNDNFMLASGAAEQVPTMHTSGSYSYMQSNGFQVLELPYAGGRLAMDVLLPTASGSQSLDVSQLPSNLTGWLSGLSQEIVNVSLPKFTLTTQFNLAGPLAGLGMSDAFSGAADFSGMTNDVPLNISNVSHKAYIGVNESGTEAAAATTIGISMSAIIAPPISNVVFNADHPFLFLIRDTQTGSVLFMGQEADPLSSSGSSSAPAITPQGNPSQAAPPSQSPGTGVSPTSPPPSGTPTMQQEMALILAHWLTNDPAEDLNHDGIVNGADIATLTSTWLAKNGASSSGGSATPPAPVPSPPTIIKLPSLPTGSPIRIVLPNPVLEPVILQKPGANFVGPIAPWLSTTPPNL